MKFNPLIGFNPYIKSSMFENLLNPSFFWLTVFLKKTHAPSMKASGCAKRSKTERQFQQVFKSNCSPMSLWINVIGLGKCSEGYTHYSHRIPNF